MSSSVSTEAAIWVRVSTDRQHEDNQIPDLERLCRHRGWAIARRYEVTDASAFRGEHRQALHQMHNMPPEARQRLLDSPDLRARFSPQEIQMLHGFNDIGFVE